MISISYAHFGDNVTRQFTAKLLCKTACPVTLYALLQPISHTSAASMTEPAAVTMAMMAQAAADATLLFRQLLMSAALLDCIHSLRDAFQCNSVHRAA